MSLIRAVWANITWQKILVIQGLACAVGVMRWFESQHYHLPNYLLVGSGFNMVIGALLLLPAGLCADELVSRGAGPRVAYSLALLIASAATAVAQWYARLWFGPAGMPTSLMAQQVAIAFVDIVSFGGIGMLAYANRRTADRILESMRRAELKRVRLEQQLIESRLATTQAQIDPRMLFSTLGEIRDDMQRAAPGADGKLDTLIHRLRTALAKTVFATDPDRATS